MLHHVDVENLAEKRGLHPFDPRLWEEFGNWMFHTGYFGSPPPQFGDDEEAGEKSE